MKNSCGNRRITADCFMAMLLAAPVGVDAWQVRTTPKPKVSPNAPTGQHGLRGLDQLPAIESNKQLMDQQNQQEIRTEVQRLYAPATELKDEVHRTDLNAVLSLSVVKRAQDIEKLARQIKDRAKR